MKTQTFISLLEGDRNYTSAAVRDMTANSWLTLMNGHLHYTPPGLGVTDVERLVADAGEVNSVWDIMWTEYNEYLSAVQAGSGMYDSGGLYDSVEPSVESPVESPVDADTLTPPVESPVDAEPAQRHSSEWVAWLSRHAVKTETEFTPDGGSLAVYTLADGRREVTLGA
jgi:hypothetical protein